MKRQFFTLLTAALCGVSSLLFAQTPNQAAKTNVTTETVSIAATEIANAPAKFQQKLKSLETEIQEKGGYAVAGQITIDGEPPKLFSDFDVLIDIPMTTEFLFYKTLLTRDISIFINPDNCIRYQDGSAFHFEDGWFITRRIKASIKNSVTIKAAGWQTEIQKTPVQPKEKKVNFYKIALKKTSDDKLVDVKGKVLSEDNQPISQAKIVLSLTLPTGTIGGELTRETFTDQSGNYTFPKIFPHNYTISATFKGYTRNSIKAKNSVSYDIVLYYPRKFTIDVVYQPDGSVDFTKENVLKDQYELLSSNFAQIHRDKKVGNRILFDPSVEKGYDDLALAVNNQTFYFRHIYQRARGNHGHYDAGKVDFDSVKNAQPEEISNGNASLCELNHVYVVQTYEHGNYAKFIVRKIETVKPEKPQM